MAIKINLLRRKGNADDEETSGWMARTDRVRNWIRRKRDQFRGLRRIEDENEAFDAAAKEDAQREKIENYKSKARDARRKAVEYGGRFVKTTASTTANLAAGAAGFA